MDEKPTFSDWLMFWMVVLSLFFIFFDIFRYFLINVNYDDSSNTKQITEVLEHKYGNQFAGFSTSGEPGFPNVENVEVLLSDGKTVNLMFDVEKGRFLHE